MSDIFWGSFFTFLMFCVKEYFDWKRSQKVLKQGKEFAEDLHNNTVATLKGVEEAASAKKATAFAAAKTVKLQEQLEEKLNGGPGGLQNLGERLAKLEESHEFTQRGLASMSRTLDQVVLEVAGLTKAIKNGHH